MEGPAFPARYATTYVEGRAELAHRQALEAPEVPPQEPAQLVPRDGEGLGCRGGLLAVPSALLATDGLGRFRIQLIVSLGSNPDDLTGFSVVTRGLLVGLAGPGSLNCSFTTL